MNNAGKIAKLKDTDYQKYFGVTKETFEGMNQILKEEYQKNHKKGGRPSVLNVLDKLVIFLQYYREYRTMEHIVFDYETNKSTICDAIHWVEETLIRHPQFHLPSKRKLLENKNIQEAAVDVTEIEIERPKKSKISTIQEKRKDIH